MASITQRGQVTIPVEVRRLLGARPRGKVVFEIEGEQVRLTTAPFDVETLAGSVKPLTLPEDLQGISRRAKEEHAERLVREMRAR